MSVCPFVLAPIAQNGAFQGYDYYGTLIGNPTLEVEPAGHPPEVAKTATMQSLVPLRKHSLGGCAIDMPREKAYRFASRYLVTEHFSGPVVVSVCGVTCVRMWAVQCRRSLSNEIKVVHGTSNESFHFRYISYLSLRVGCEVLR